MSSRAFCLRSRETKVEIYLNGNSSRSPANAVAIALGDYAKASGAYAKASGAYAKASATACDSVLRSNRHFISYYLLGN